MDLVSANNVDPVEMQHYAAFHLGLHSLPKYQFWVSNIQRIKELKVMRIWNLLHNVNREGFDEPVQTHGLVRAFATCTHEQGT